MSHLVAAGIGDPDGQAAGIYCQAVRHDQLAVAPRAHHLSRVLQSKQNEFRAAMLAASRNIQDVW